MSETTILRSIEERHGVEGRTLSDYAASVTMEDIYPLEPLPPLDADVDLYSICNGDSFCPLFSM